MTARLFHADLWGLREVKYAWLAAQEVHTVKWTPVQPSSPYYFFVPKDERLRQEYETWPKITDVFAQNVAGIITARDDFAIGFDDKALLTRIAALRDRQRGDDAIRDEFFAGKGSKKYLPGDSRGWKLPEARRKVQNDPDWRKRTADILYRPFDMRRIYFVSSIVDWPRTDLMPTMLEDNLALAIGRQGQVIGSDVWDIVFSSRTMMCSFAH